MVSRRDTTRNNWMNCWICQSVKSGVGGSNDAPNCHSCVHRRGSNIGNNPLAKVSTDSATYKNFRTNLTFCETKVSTRKFGLRWRHPFCMMWHAGASLLKKLLLISANPVRWKRNVIGLDLFMKNNEYTYMLFFLRESLDVLLFSTVPYFSFRYQEAGDARKRG